MKRTPWFNCQKQPPVRPGTYEVHLWVDDPNDPDGPRFSMVKVFFNGLWWCSTAGRRLQEIDRPGWHKKDQWRGLTRGMK